MRTARVASLENRIPSDLLALELIESAIAQTLQHELAEPPAAAAP